MEALRGLAEVLPTTAEAMLQVPHMTRALVDKYGEQLLEVTERYAAEKIVLEAERQAELNDAAKEEFQNPDPPSEFASSHSAAGGSRGFKRKSAGAGAAYHKRPRKTAFKKKTWSNNASKAPGKFSGSPSKTRKKTAGKSAGKSAKRTGGASTSSGFGALPMPKPQQPVAKSRSFLGKSKVVEL